MAFKNPIEPRNQRPKDVKNSPFNYACPQYDNRGGSFVNVGTHYGVGYNVNVGHTGPAKKTVDVLPYGRVQTKKVDEIG
jgi:hypothetical protein